MSKSKLEKFQDECARTAGRSVEMHGYVDTAIMAALNIASEGGEFINHVKKIAYHGHKLTPELKTEMAYELGDLLWAVAISAKALGFSLDLISEMTTNKLKDRYPSGFSEERSQNRKESTIPNSVYVSENKFGIKPNSDMEDAWANKPTHATPLAEMKPIFDHSAASKAAEDILKETDDNGKSTTND